MHFIGLIKKFSQFRLFFAKKIKKIAYTGNGKDTPNILRGLSAIADLIVLVMSVGCCDRTR